MDPLWIIDLSSKPELTKDFFSKYWQAYLLNSETQEDPWFFISSSEDLGLIEDNLDQQWTEELIFEKINQIIKNFAKILTVNIDGKEKIIKFNFEDNISTLNILVIGDIHNKYTQLFSNIIIAELRKKRCTSDSWTEIPNVYFIGLYYRNTKVGFSNGLTDKEKVFLHQLHNLQNEIALFDNILFFQSEDKEYENTIKQMALTALHIGNGGNDVLFTYQIDGQKQPFLNAGISGIFYEKEVQNERDAFLLGYSLIDSFINNETPIFVDNKSAQNYTDEIPVFKKDLFSTHHIIDSLTINTNSPFFKEIEKEPTVSPSSWSLKRVWNEYYQEYVINLKKNLINNLRYEFLSVENIYKETVSNNHFDWFREKSSEIEKGVFDIFKSDNPDQHCSIKQAIIVAENCKKKIQDKQTDFDKFKKQETLFTPFPLSDRYQKAYEMALKENKGISEKEILDKLENKLKFHPVFLLSVFIRAVLIGILLIFVGIPLIKFVSPQLINLEFLANNLYLLGFVLAIIPIIIYLWKFRSYTQQIKSLRDQYIAYSLVRLNERLTKFVFKTIDKTYADLVDFIEKWLIDKKLIKGLQKQLGVINPPEFSFQEFKNFQPLLKDRLNQTKQNNFLFNPELSENKEMKNSLFSGSFNGKDLLCSNNDCIVKLKNNNKNLSSLDDSNKMELIRGLMSEKAEIFASIVEEVQWSKIKLSSGSSKVLLLDVSGSMSGEPLTQLKKVVKEYKERYGDLLRWVAFATEARLDKDVNDEIDKASKECGGGTSYSPAFQLITDNLRDFDRLIMISDGDTCDIDQAIEIAKKIGNPVDVIYIGKGSKDHLQRLASETGGEFTAVDKIEDIEEEIKKGLDFIFAMGIDGEREFWQLLKLGNVEACARALRTFSKNKIENSDYSLEKIIETKGNDDGILEMIKMGYPTCSLSPGIIEPPDLHIHFKSSDFTNGISQNSLVENKLKSIKNIDYSSKYNSPPDLLASYLCLNPLKNGLKDLNWAYKSEADLQFKNSEEDPFCKIILSYFGKDAQLKNLYDNSITNN